MRKSGYVGGYHPSPNDLSHLKILDKKKRTYIDPRNGKTYSNRAVQEARGGYLTIEHSRDLKKQGWTSDVLTWTGRGKQALSIPSIANSWERKHGMPQGTAFKSKKFLRELKRTVDLINEPYDDDWYEELSDYLDDSFGLEIEELDFYHN